MLSIKRTKELLNNPCISDKEAEEIRDGFRIFAEIIFEKWQEEKIQIGKLKDAQCSNTPQTDQ